MQEDLETKKSASRELVEFLARGNSGADLGKRSRAPKRDADIHYLEDVRREAKEGDGKNKKRKSIKAKEEVPPWIRIVTVPTDGHCFFHCLAHCLEEKDATRVCNELVEFIQKDIEKYARINQGKKLVDIDTYQRYLTSVQAKSEWADQSCIEAAQQLYHVRIFTLFESKTGNIIAVDNASKTQFLNKDTKTCSMYNYHNTHFNVIEYENDKTWEDAKQHYTRKKKSDTIKLTQ